MPFIDDPQKREAIRKRLEACIEANREQRERDRECQEGRVIEQVRQAQEIIQELDVEPENHGKILAALIQALSTSALHNTLIDIADQLDEIRTEVGRD